jgi:predicted DCC family thiol-disulfide oxidoreductase YuxK
MPSTETLPSDPAITSWKIKLLYDGLCPMCMREVNFLQKRDAGRGIVAFVDIADLNYTPQDHGGVEFEEAMGRIHAVLPDGTVIRDVEVFRRVYEELGMGWIYAATRWPILGVIANQLYALWAKLRLALTGRPTLEVIVADRQQRLEANNRCRMDGLKENSFDNGKAVFPAQSALIKKIRTGYFKS